MSPSAPGIRRDTRLPFYDQLKWLILTDIEQKGLRPGELLPSETEMCERYDVSRTVVRQAIGELVNEGIVVRQRGRGTFVVRPKWRENFMQSTVGFFEDLTVLGLAVKSKVINCEFVKVSKSVADALETEPGAKRIEVVRLRSVNDELVAFTKSYLNSDDPNLLDSLKAADLTTQSLYRVLEERAGLRIESGHRSLEAISASGLLPKMLDISPGAPVIYIESVGRDSVGRPVEFFQAWHRADRTRLEIDVVRGRGLTAQNSVTTYHA
jgi:GntR family transcriptional regulator